MREASLLASKFFKELAEVFNDEEGQGKFFPLIWMVPRGTLKFSAGEKIFPSKNGLQKSPKEFYLANLNKLLKFYMIYN